MAARRPNRRRKTKPKYMLRRIGFLLVCFLVILFLIRGLTKLVKPKDSEEDTEERASLEVFLQGPLAMQKINADLEQINFRRQAEAENATGEEKPKRVFLTFDDGPSEHITPQVLDLLDEYQVKATFFVLGKNVDAHPEVLQEVISRGHAIGNHSYSHEYDKIYRSMDAYMEDFYLCERAIKNAVGQGWRGDLLRFPGGSFEAYKQPIGDHLNQLGYHFFDWNAINGDGESDSYAPEFMVEKFKDTASGKKTIIALFHDSDTKQKSVESLGPIIEWLQEEDYEFLTLEQR